MFAPKNSCTLILASEQWIETSNPTGRMPFCLATDIQGEEPRERIYSVVEEEYTLPVFDLYVGSLSKQRFFEKPSRENVYRNK